MSLDGTNSKPRSRSNSDTSDRDHGARASGIDGKIASTSNDKEMDESETPTPKN